jgi:hypothetical protein
MYIYILGCFAALYIRFGSVTVEKFCLQGLFTILLLGFLFVRH